MQQVADKVNFTLSFIGTWVIPRSLPPDVPDQAWSGSENLSRLTRRVGQPRTMVWTASMARLSVRTQLLSRSPFPSSAPTLYSYAVAWANNLECLRLIGAKRPG